MQPLEDLTPEEILYLSAEDSEFFGRFFFPKTCRQKSPDFHKEMDRVMEDPRNRYVSFQVFRGGAKTTKLRLFAAKRIAFAISRTILIVGKSQDHAAKTLEWLMKAIEFNKAYATFFRLKKGFKWNSTELEIINESAGGVRIRVLAMGITGSIRGLNIDDHRPDLILLDDPVDEENAATTEQRDKVENLLYGALMKSLAPASESPDACLVLAQTPLHPEDISEKSAKDPAWAFVRFSCFNEKGESQWPDRWTTEELLREKQSHIERNLLPLWLREMECTLVTEQYSAFKREWLIEAPYVPEGGIILMGIDPTPPPKDNLVKQKNRKLDDAVICIIKYVAGNVYICETWHAKSPDPEEFANAFFSLAGKWRPFKIGIETILFQRMLKWYLEREMVQRRQFYTLIPVEDKRQKEVRIIQTISRYASNGRLHILPGMSELREQFYTFQQNATGQRDDFLDALSIALDLISPGLEGLTIEGEYDLVDESDIPELTDWRTAP